MVPTRVAELAACLNGAERPTPLDAQRYAGLAGLLPASLSVPVGGDLDAVVELLHGIGRAEADLATGPTPSPKHDLLREILSDRVRVVVTWSDAILAWRGWERIWHGVHIDPAGAGVVDVADSLLWLGPGDGDAHRRLRQMDVPDVRDGDLVVGHLADRQRGEAWFAGGRLGPRRFASVLAAAYGRTDRLRHRRVVVVGISPETPAEHEALFELATGRLRQVLDGAGLDGAGLDGAGLDGAGTDRRKRNIMCTIYAGGAESESGLAGQVPPVPAGQRAMTWVEIVLPTGERFDLDLSAGELLIPADYPVERDADGQHTLVCLDDVHRMYTLARSALLDTVPGSTVPEPTVAEPTATEPAGADEIASHLTSHLEITNHLDEITSLSKRIDERLRLLPAQLRQRFEAELAGARAGIEELPRPDPQGGWGLLRREQVAQVRQTRDALTSVAESIGHDVLHPEVSERLFREAAQLLDTEIKRRIEEVRLRIASLDQPHRDTAAAGYDRIQRTLTEALQALRGEASAARSAGAFTPQDMRRIEHQAYRCTLDAYEQLGELLENLRSNNTRQAA